MLIVSENDVEHTHHWTHPPLNTPTIEHTHHWTLFGDFHIITYQVLKLWQNTKQARYVSFVHL